MIVLDWTRPWSFVEELQTWLQWVETWAKGDGSRELEMVREEGRERLQAHLQHYAEPSTDPLPANSTVSGTLLPLASGTFTHNSSGIPIIVTCTKADLIDDGNDMAAGASGMGSMVKGKGGEWEERTDGTDGASLFYTTTVPSTVQVLRQYALHALFMPPAPSPISSSGEPQGPIRNVFSFQHKPNTLDRDRIVVPAGWDSWGKISVMRDGFDAKLWGEAWERDLTDDTEGVGASKLYASLVPDQGTKPPPLPPFNNPTPEQSFLAKNYDENAKKPDRDPRGAFRNPTDLTGASAGIVGPLGSSSFNLPNVERALTDMEVGMGGGPGAGAADAARRSTRIANAPSGRPAGLAPVGTSAPASGRAPASPIPASAGSPSPTGGQTQHEVLQNFFQSLLSSKDRTGSPASARTAPSTASKATGGGSGTEE
ncbi:hypothetical protein DXG03_000122 [Asterophora parasitica]|uniref:Dynein light intermediate chain n=1 Tax=Asterophora parasitica TaxID=117018 RepID=A0A9P7GEV7_9AGAR|nr:hypothetical protein DXG03_000122 [Asterophora parasitica]